MRFRTRVLLLWLLPVTALLTVSFWMIQLTVQARVRDSLRQSLRQNHAAISSARGRLEARENRFLRIAGENSALKASLQLVLLQGGAPSAEATLEDQLSDLCERMGFDLLIAATPNREVLAGVIRSEGKLIPLSDAEGSGKESQAQAPARDGLFYLRQEIYNTTGIPIEISGETVASLIVGDRFELSSEAGPAVLLRRGKVVRSAVRGVSPEALELALQACPGKSECDVQINGTGYISMPVRINGQASDGDEFSLLSLQDADASLAPVLASLRWVFFTVFGIAAALALVCGLLSAQSIVRPISLLVSHLQAAGQDGRLGAVNLTDASGVTEIDELTRSFNRAAAATSAARANLEAAYAQFVGSLAKALDARDRYTAGHSQRVSELSCRIAVRLGMSEHEVERVRMGALLHDIGKIGVSDIILQKPGRLSDVETAMIRRHPEIGRRILEKVEGFAEWLDAVELHHENWDGSGYPHGLKGETVPLDARIIHVADAYDAMTSDRPYRNGMGHEKAILAIRAAAGSHFDPGIVACITDMPDPWGKKHQHAPLRAKDEAASILSVG